MIDTLGRHLGDRGFDATTAGHAVPIASVADRLIAAIGGEGTGTYGAWPGYALTARGLTVIDVDRPDR